MTTPETNESASHLNTGNLVKDKKDLYARRRREIEEIFETQPYSCDPGRPTEESIELTDKGKPTPAFGGKAARRQMTMRDIERELVFRPAIVEPLCFVLRRGL